jgi:hypothetical protein
MVKEFNFNINSLNQNPSPINVMDYGWEVDKANKSMISQNVVEGIPYAPEQNMKLVKCCVSQRPCKGANCGCLGHQLPCTMFCSCDGGCNFLNPFNTNDTDETVSEE